MTFDEVNASSVLDVVDLEGRVITKDSMRMDSFTGRKTPPVVENSSAAEQTT
jgi:hypothetical protein